MSNQPERRRRFVRAAAPAFGLLAAGLLVWQGSYAAFSATTNDTNNTWSSGSLTLTNDGGTGTFAASTSATFGGTTLKPGSTGTTCLTVKSTGTSAGTLAMYESALADSSPSLGAQIQLTVTAGVAGADVPANCTGFPATATTLYTNQPLSTFPNTYAAAVTAGGTTPIAGGAVFEAYKVVWTFATTGTNAGDNLLQGKSVTSAFQWEVQ
jgi:hypothetical protein